MNEKQAETLKLIQDEEKKGCIVFARPDGTMACSVEQFMNQPVEGMLYDLNRDKVTTITLADTSEVMGMRWINDYAVAVVITALKAEIDRLNSAIMDQNNQSK